MKLEAERELEEDKYDNKEVTAVNIKTESIKPENVKEEPEIITEKIVTLSSSSSSNKQIALKKEKSRDNSQDKDLIIKRLITYFLHYFVNKTFFILSFLLLFISV